MVFIAVWASLQLQQAGATLVVVGRLLTAVVSPLVEHRPRAHGLSCGSQAPERRPVWCTGLVTPQHVGSFQIRDGTQAFYIVMQILYRRATREADILCVCKGCHNKMPQKGRFEQQSSFSHCFGG